MQDQGRRPHGVCVVEAGILALAAAAKLAAAPAAGDPLAEAWSQAKAMTTQGARPSRPVPGQDRDEVPVITPLPDSRKPKERRQVASMSAIDKAIEDMALSWSGIGYVRGSRTQATFQLALVASSLLEARRQGYELIAVVALP